MESPRSNSSFASVGSKNSFTYASGRRLKKDSTASLINYHNRSRSPVNQRRKASQNSLLIADKKQTIQDIISKSAWDRKLRNYESGDFRNKNDFRKICLRNRSVTPKRSRTTSPINHPTIDTSSVTKKIITRRKKPKVKKEKQNRQEDMRTELMLKSNHHIIRSMKQLKTENLFKVQTNRLLDSSFNRVYIGLVKPEKEGELKDVLKEIKEEIKEEEGEEEVARYVVMKTQDAYVRANEDHRDKWMKRHGKEGNIAESKKFLRFIKQLFEALDDDGSGTLEPDELILPLITMGISPDAKYIGKCLRAIYKTNNLDELSIQKDEFLQIFKGDRKYDHILNILDMHCKSMLLDEKERKQAEEIARKQKPTHISMFEPTDEYAEVPEGVLKLQYSSMVDIDRMIKMWWNSLDTLKQLAIHVNKISDFLVEQKFVINRHEGVTLIRAVKNPVQNMVNFPHFERIFAKAIFKGALRNVASGMSKGDYADDILPVPLRLKIAQYQRRLILAGLYNRKKEKLDKHGKSVISAVEKFKKEVGIYDDESTKQQVINLVHAALNADDEDFVYSEDYLNSDTGTRNLRATKQSNSIEVLKNFITQGSNYQSNLINEIKEEQDKIYHEKFYKATMSHSDSKASLNKPLPKLPSVQMFQPIAEEEEEEDMRFEKSVMSGKLSSNPSAYLSMSPYRPESLQTHYTDRHTPDIDQGYDSKPAESEGRPLDIVWETISTRDEEFKPKFFSYHVVEPIKKTPARLREYNRDLSKFASLMNYNHYAAEKAVIGEDTPIETDSKEISEDN